MKIPNMFKRKDFFVGLLLGLLIMAIASVVIVWTVAQHVNLATSSTVEQVKESGTAEQPVEEVNIVSEIVKLIKKEKEIKFLDMKIQGEMSLKPTLVFNFQGEMGKHLDEKTENELIQFSPTIAGQFHWPDSNTLSFTVNEPLTEHTTYQAILQKEVFDSLGVKINGKDTISFTTEGSKEAKLIGMNPKMEVDPKANLTFTFSEDVADLNQVGQNYKNDLIQLNPPVPGSYRWINLRQLRFLPEVPFKPSTHYQVTIKPEIVTTRAYYLDNELVKEFDTAKFEVLSSKVQLINNTQKSSSELTARVVFNYPVNPDELKKYIGLYLINGDEEEELSYEIKPYRISETFELNIPHFKQVDAEQKVRLLVAKGLVCEDGTIGLANDYVSVSAISPLDPLKLYSVYGDRDYSMGTITLEFSRPVEADSAEAFISVSPEVSYKVEVYKDIVRLKSEDFKPLENYQITVNAGMPAINAAPLEEIFVRNIRMPGLSPLVRFNSQGYYLSNQGNLTLGLETVNLNKVDVGIYKIYANNIVHFLSDNRWGSFEDRFDNLGSLIEEFTLEVNNPPNEIVETPLSLEDYMDDERKGIYQIVVRDRDNYWLNDSRMIVATDIGIVTKLATNELAVWVNSLKTLQPLIKARVSLLSRNNQVLTKGETNRQGLVKFTDLGNLFKDFEPYLIVVEYEDDFAFLKLDDGRLDTTDFDTTGRSYLTEGYEAYVYSDRGVYRPGDKANITALIRGVNVAVPPEFPVRLKVIDPTGNLYTELVQNTGDAGAAEFEINLPDYVKTGKYTTNLYVADQMIGVVNFNVEEFMPDRIKVQVESDEQTYSSGDTAEIKVSGVNLFGPPAAGRNVEVAVKLDVVPFTTSAYKSYIFGDSSIKSAGMDEIIGSGTLDENGEYRSTFSFPTELKPGNMMKAAFSATVREEGGRAVTNYQVVDFHPYESYIGLKRLSDYYGEIDKPYQIQYVEVNPQGESVAGSSLMVKVYRVIWHSLWRQDGNGEWYYESEEELEEIYSQELISGFGEQIFDFTPREYGKYKVVIANTENHTQSAIDFYATGWGYSPWALTNPTRIELDLDKPIYENGELAQIQVKAPFSGKALVTIEREKIYDLQIVEFKDNTGLLAVNVKDDWKPNVYVTVQLIRSIDSVEIHSPVRAFGTIALPVSSSSSRLDVEIKTEEELRPNQTVDVDVAVKGASEEAYLTLAAVDEGILQLTNFPSPNPYNFFYGKKKLDVGSYDLYNMILPEVEKVNDPSAPGGDRYAEAIQKENLNPISVQRVKPVSLWSGIVKLDEQGQAKVKLDLPQFNGTLRLMAVVFDGSKMGSQDKQVIVRDPIVLTSTYPRFISGTDKFQVPVSIFNGTDEDGEFTVKMTIDGPVNQSGDSEQKIELTRGAEGLITFDLEAQNAVGTVNFTLEVTGNGQSSKEETELALRPAVPLVKEFLSGSIKPDQSVELSLPVDWVEGTDGYTLTISPFPAVQFAGSLQYLLDYPYGCAEQTTSRLFPLLYFDDLAKKADPELFVADSADYYIEEGILKLQTMQLANGDFAYWPGGYRSYRWVSIYVSHFLVEARKAGYAVSNNVYDKMIDNLTTIARESAYETWELQNKVYALYVLSQVGKADLSNMAYIKNHQWDKLSDDSRVMLAAAYYFAGERGEANRLIPFSFQKPEIERETGGNFNSNVRHDALILSVLAEVDPDHPAIPSLVQRLTSEVSIGRWGTTQENAFAFMAIGKMLQARSEDNYTGKIFVDDIELGSFSNSAGVEIKDPQLAKGKLKITLTGTGESYYFAEIKGVPLSGDVQSYDHGVKVSRDYLNKDGHPLDTDQIKQGDLVIAKITVTGQKKELNNLVIVDMLPAGLEIENPRLQSRANIEWLQEESFPVDYLDMRDDRLLLFTNLYNADKSLTFYYALRAVTVGEFLLPPIKAECMYEPEIASVSEAGMIKVVK